MTSAARALRQALRALLRQPGFTLVTVATYALGIGACTAVFSIFDTMLLRPLPFGPDSARLVTLHSTHTTQSTDWGDSNLSPPDLIDLTARAGSLERVEALFSRNFVLSAEDGADRVRGLSVTPGLLPMLGAEPAIGRSFRPEEGAEIGFESVALISWRLWQSRFAGDPKIVGAPVRINGRERTVIGVMPPGFRFPEREDIWMPYRLNAASDRTRRFLFPIAVRKSDAGIGQVQAELSGIAASLAREHPATNRGWGVKVFPIRELLIGSEARVLSGALLAAVFLVLAVAGANVAGLLFARAAARRREMAIRSSLGAARRRLVGEMLIENLLLAAAGALLGWFLAGLFLEAVIRSSPDLPYWMGVVPDARLAVFTILLMSTVGILVGIAPALRACSGSLLPDLQGQAPGSTEPVGAQRMQALLVAGQVAASLALLIAAQLLIRNYLAMQYADAGFDDSRVLSMRLYLPGDRYDPISARTGFYRDALQRVTSLPGIEAAAGSSAVPIDDGGGPARLIAEGGVPNTRDELGVTVLAIAGNFHETLGLALEGRAFTAREQEPDGPPAVILGRALARRLFPAGDGLSRRIGLVGERGTTWYPIVGIAPDVQFEEFGESTTTSTMNVFVPYALSAPRTMALLVRASSDPAAHASAVRGAVREVEPDAALYDIRSMQTVREETTWGQRFFGKALGGFAGAALFLAGLGAWGLVAHSVARRHREIGIRLALGAEPRRVVGLFAGRALRAAAAGALIGLGLGLAAAAALRGTLFGVKAFDMGGFALASLLLVAVVALASVLPARRAARVDPASTLRSE